MTWSEELKTIRATHNLTVPKMAEIIGVPQRTLENWLGDKNTPNGFVQNAVRDKLKQ